MSPANGHAQKDRCARVRPAACDAGHLQSSHSRGTVKELVRHWESAVIPRKSNAGDDTTKNQHIRHVVKVFRTPTAGLHIA